jgi:hypothetical protein
MFTFQVYFLVLKKCDISDSNVTACGMSGEDLIPSRRCMIFYFIVTMFRMNGIYPLFAIVGIRGFFLVVK